MGDDAPEEGLGRAIHPCLRDYKVISTTVIPVGASGLCGDDRRTVLGGHVRLRQVARPESRRKPDHPADPGPRRNLRWSAVRREGISRIRHTAGGTSRRPRSGRCHRDGPRRTGGGIPRGLCPRCDAARIDDDPVQFQRRLLCQSTTPLRSPVAAALRGLICYERQRCKHGHTIDVRLSHQDLSELVGAARPVVGAELVRMRGEGLVEYTRCYFCVDDPRPPPHRHRRKLLELLDLPSGRQPFGGMPASLAARRAVRPPGWTAKRVGPLSTESLLVRMGG